MSSKQPLLSVILCNYNYGRFVAEAIDGVLCQTYANFELIIVDDGSTDDSQKVISSYEDPRIYSIFQEKSGQATAFNAGFRVAKGKIVALLDSDDWWKPEKLETMVRWHEFLQGDYAVLQHNLDIWDNGKKKPSKLILPVGSCFAESQRSGRLDYFVPTSGLVFRKVVLEQIFPIPMEIWICADAYLTRTAFVFGKVHSIPESLGFYRKHQNYVFGNDYFDSSRFLHKIVFPALNRFYQAKKLSYRIDYNDGHSRSRWTWIPVPVRTLLSPVKHWLKSRLRSH